MRSKLVFKALLLLLAISLLSSLAAFTVSADEENTPVGKRIVYVDGTELQSNGGNGTRDNPYAKLSVAINDLKDTGGEIVLVSDLDLIYEYGGITPEEEERADFNFHFVNPSHTKPIVIRSESLEERKKIYFSVGRSAASWTMGGPTIFENVEFAFNQPDENGVKYGYKRIFSNGHPLVMGYGCESNNSTYFHLGKSPHYEGVREKDGENDFIAFYSGTWSYLFGPNAEYDTTNAEYAYYILGEATIKGYIAVGPMNGYFTDKASLYVNTTGAVGAIHSAYKIGNGSVDIYLDKGEVGTVNANSFSGGNGDVLSVYLSDCKITGLLNGDSQSSFDETHLYLSENAKINCKYTEFDKTDKTYKYSSSPYDAINAKVEAMKNDFLAEKPADPSEGEEEENKDPEGEAPSTGNVTDEKEEEKNIFLEISAEYETVLIIVTAVFTLAMIVIVIVKLIPKKKK